MESPNVVSNPEFVIDNGKRTSCVKQLILCLDMVNWGFFPLWKLSVFFKIEGGGTWKKMCVKIA